MKWTYLRESLRFLFMFLDELLDPLPTPGRPAVVAHREVFTKMSTGLTKQMGYTIAHPALPTPNDVVKLNLHVTLDGTAGDPIPVNPGDTHEVIAPLGVKVEITFTSVDDAGNESEHSAPLSFTSVDDIPPEAPGVPTVQSHREILTPDGPTPTPDPTPSPAPSPIPAQEQVVPGDGGPVFNPPQS